MVTIKNAEGEAEAMRKIAEAQLVKDEKAGAGTKAQLLQQSEGLTKLFEKNPHFSQFYLGLTHGLYTQLADANAKAVNGLQPKINIWSTGQNNDGKDPTVSAIQNLFKGIAPMFDVLQQQTNIKLPFVQSESDSNQNNTRFEYNNKTNT